jgi:hypothetical protein
VRPGLLLIFQTLPMGELWIKMNEVKKDSKLG